MAKTIAIVLALIAALVVTVILLAIITRLVGGWPAWAIHAELVVKSQLAAWGW